MNIILDSEQINPDKREDQDLVAKVDGDSDNMITTVCPRIFSRSVSGETSFSRPLFTLSPLFTTCYRDIENLLKIGSCTELVIVVLVFFLFFEVVSVERKTCFLKIVSFPNLEAKITSCIPFSRLVFIFQIVLEVLVKFSKYPTLDLQ